MNLNHRELSQHVEFESETYYAAFSAELEIASSPMWSLISHCRSKVSWIVWSIYIKHVEFESETYYAAFSAELETASSPMWSLISHCRSKVRLYGLSLYYMLSPRRIMLISHCRSKVGFIVWPVSIQYIGNFSCRVILAKDPWKVCLIFTESYFYAPGLKGPPGASSNRIVCPSVLLSVRPSVHPSVRSSVRNSVPLTNKVQYLKFWWSYSNQTWTVSSSMGSSHFTDITCPLGWGGVKM